MAFERITLSVAGVAILGLAACQAPLPGQTNENTQNFGLGGAAVGALVGVATADDDDDRLDRAVAGAVLGGVAGAGIGNALDRQEAELRAELGNGTIVNNGNQLIVTLPNDIVFGFDSASVSVQSQSDLQAVAASLNRYPNTTVNVIGHTDNVGDAAYNQDLSERRASAVARILIASGVSASRINIVGRGEDQPVASNQTTAGRAANRRVEIVITPN